MQENESKQSAVKQSKIIIQNRKKHTKVLQERSICIQMLEGCHPLDAGV
jgi:hypothetical protein